MRKVVFLLMLISYLFVGNVAIASSVQHYKTIVHILNYSNLPKTAQICVFDDVQMTAELRNYLKQANVSYEVTSVTPVNFVRSNCQAVYFPNMSPQQENQLINRYPTPLLSMSERNIQCEIGSAFCLYTRGENISVKLNLDTLTRSKVKVDPRVLRMWASATGE